MRLTDWRPLGRGPEIMVAVHKLFFKLQRRPEFPNGGHSESPRCKGSAGRKPATA